MSEDGQVRFSLRMPDDLHQQVVQAASMSGRSVNAELLARLQGSFDAPDFAIVVQVLAKLGERMTGLEEKVDRLVGQHAEP